MARRSDEVKALKARLQALPPDDRAQVIKSVLTPAMRFCLLVDDAWKKQGRQDPRAVARAVHAARQEAEREHSVRPERRRERKRAS